MTDALQTDESGITLDENKETNTEATESGADLAPASGEDQTKNDDGKQQVTEIAKKAINKQHFKFKEQERRADALDKENVELKEKLAATEAEKGDIVIPPIPDPFDEDYESKIALRDDAIMQKAAQDAKQQSVIEQQDATNEAAKKVDQERSENLVKGFDARIVTLGLEPETIRNAVNTVVEYGISKDVGEYILEHEDGPLITQYLAEHPIELDELRNLPPIMAAMKINSDIKLAASVNKPQASNAPDPTEVLSGRGAGELESPLLKGATFD